jgi:hypothetical protein
VIEDEADAERTCREMIDDGMPVVDDLPPQARGV